MFRRALKGGVTSDGWVALEGPILFEEALRAEAKPSHLSPLRSSARIRSVLVTDAATHDNALESLSGDAEIAQTPDRIFRSLSQTVNPQGIAALVEIRAPEFSKILAEPDLILLVACGVRDPGNLGTMMRTGEAFGAGAVVTLKSTVNAFNPKVTRSSGGAVFRLPVYPGWEADLLFKRLRAAGIRTVAANPDGKLGVTGADLRGPLAILIGNEAAGLDPELARQADLHLRIPIRAEINSVNAAISAGILLYEAARQRGFKY